jgi:hypothetical protein
MDSQCTGDAGMTRCGPDAQCVQCASNADCASQTTDKVCNTMFGRCAVCVQNSDCTNPAKPFCGNPGGGGAQCVQCTRDSQCSADAGGPTCNRGVCGP